MSFWYMTKRSRQKLKYIEDQKSFCGEIKSIFIIFKGLSVAKNCLRRESAPLKSNLKSQIFFKENKIVLSVLHALYYAIFSQKKKKT